MKVQRKMAKVYNGEPMPFKLQLAISQGKADTPKPSEAKWPICNAVRWMRHGDHPAVLKVSDTHGMVRNYVGNWSPVAPGEHIIEMKEGGVIHHPYQDISRWYDIK